MQHDSRRNFAILLAIVAVVFLFTQVSGDGGSSVGRGFGVIFFVLNILFMLAIGYVLFNAYRRHKETIDSLEQEHQLILKGCGIGGYIILVTGLAFPAWGMFGPGFALIFFASLAGCGYGVWWAWQQRSTWGGW